MFCLPGLSQAAMAPGRDCHLPGSQESLRCHAIAVSLDPQRQDGTQLQLHVTVAPAFRQGASKDPLFVLAGGPGQAGSDLVALLGPVFQRVRATRDIVFIDQRGTGLSGKLRCPGAPVGEATSDAALHAAFARCIGTLPHPLGFYTTAHAAHDLERVRLALGYGKVNVFGGSYGTRLGQSYARSYPGSVRALILDGVAAPERVIPVAAASAQRALDGVFARCAADAACADAFPGLRAEFDTLLARVNAGSVTLAFAHPRTAQPTRLPLSNMHFVYTIQRSLYSARDSHRLPYLIHSAHQGNWGPFLARSHADTDYSPEGPLAMPLLVAILCAEDIPRLTLEQREADERGSFLRGHAQRLAALCPLAGVSAAATPPNTPIHAPVLLLSGALDPVTPPDGATSAARTMTHAQHLVARHAAHGVSNLGDTPRLLRAFLDEPTRALDKRGLDDIPLPPFQLDHAGTHP
ncbi:alpha/beta hydrolase [Massilia sp. Se16.2.3]|nr:alpha/beta hydrolase [Massilia sp. Se16.2.3]